MNKLQIIPSVLLALAAGCASPSIDPLPLPDPTPPPRFPEPDPPMIERSPDWQSAAPALPATLSIPQRVQLGQFNIPADGLFVVERSVDLADWHEVHRFWVPQGNYVADREAALSYDFDVEWRDPIASRAFFRIRQIPLNP